MNSCHRWRAAATAVVCVATFTSLAPALAAQLPSPRTGTDHLTLTVADTGRRGADGTYELRCHPVGGNHPDAPAACARLDSLTKWGRDLFAPVPPDAICTMQYGGPATARLTGTWAGRPVDARFSRSTGCEISRWDSFVPLLPSTASQ